MAFPGGTRLPSETHRDGAQYSRVTLRHTSNRRLAVAMTGWSSGGAMTDCEVETLCSPTRTDLGGDAPVNEGPSVTTQHHVSPGEPSRKNSSREGLQDSVLAERAAAL